MKYGYVRCSTDEGRQDIGRQVRELVQMGVPEENIFQEYDSGMKTDRIQLNRLLSMVQAGDEIATTEISRLTRSTRQLCDLISFVEQHKIRLVIKDLLVIDCTGGEMDPLTKAFLQMAGVFAELERNIISARIKSGLKNAAAKGKQIGRPKLTFERIPDRFLRYYALYQSQGLSVTELARLAGVSRMTAYRYLELLEKRKDLKVKNWTGKKVKRNTGNVKAKGTS